MNDILYRGIIDALDIRFVLADCPQSTQEIILKHNCDPISAHVLTRAVGAAILTSALLTEDEVYTLRWNYTGKLTFILADCNAEGHVRAMMNPTDLMSQVQAPSDIWGEDGTVTVIKHTAKETLNSGTTEAGLLDVVDDLAFYFSTSDQIETAMAVIPVFRPDPEAPVKSCRAVMLQALPNCDLERFARIRERLTQEDCRKLLMEPVVPDNLFERFAMLLCQGETDNHNFTLEKSITPQFRCSCSKERMAATLATLERKEIEDMLAERGSIAVTCRFCNTRHEIKREDIHFL